MHLQIRRILAECGTVPDGRLRGTAPLLLIVSGVLLILHVFNAAAYGQTVRAETAAPVGSTRAGTTSAGASSKPASSYGELPLSFEANQGQTDAQVRFLSRGNGYSLFLTDKEAVLALRKPASAKAGNWADRLPGASGRPDEPWSKTDVVRMQLAGARAGTRVSGENKLPGVANYFAGSDPAEWRSGVPTYGKVKYAGVYPGVDLVYYGNQRQLEYDFVVAPFADTSPIQLRFAGAKKLKLDASGDLEIIAENGQIAFHKPVVYQEKDGVRVAVNGRFTQLNRDSVGFAVGDYDRSIPLVIDPTLSYSTYLGGSNGDGYGTAIAVDSSGDAYVTGVVYATNFPATTGAYQTGNKSSASTFDAFVAKLNPTGTALVYATYLGGSGNTSVAGTLNHGDYPTGISVDSSGDAYVSGIAYSVDFPISSGAVQKTNQGGANGVSNCFVTEIDAAGSGLVYSTYLGGSGISGYAGQASLGDTGGDGCASIAIDSSGDAYVTGTAYSTNFPVTGSAYQAKNKSASAGRPNAFVAKLNPQGSALDYATYLGGSNGDGGSGIAVDSSGDAYIDGATYSTDFPVTGGVLQSTNNTTAAVGSNGFVTKLNSTGSSLVYSTYLGGSGNSNGASGNNNGDAALSIALDSSDDAFVYGLTSSEDFPATPGAYQTVNNAFAAGHGPNFFIAKIDPTAASLTYATYLGGSELDANPGSSGLAVDSSGDAYITGYEIGSDFPVSANAYQSSPACPFATYESGSEYESPIFSEISPDGATLLYSTYLGGTGHVIESTPVSSVSLCDEGYGVALDSQSNVYLTGSAASTNFPTTSGAFQTSNPAEGSAYVSKFLMNSNATTIATTTSLAASANPATVGASVTFTATVTPASGNGVPTGTVAFSIDGVAGTPVTLNGSAQASYATSTLAVGTHTVTASYSGDTGYTASNSNNFTETINAASSGTVATPTFSPIAGTYASALTITITDTTAGAAIYYTTDGTTPTAGSLKYSGPISVSGSETIKAIATESGYTTSAVATAAYVISPEAPAAGIITTVAGDGTQGYSGDDGPALEAAFQFPFGVAVDSSGNFYIADEENNVVRKVTTAGVITTFAGNGTAGYSGDGGQASEAELSGPERVSLDSNGNLYIADTLNNVIREVSPAGVITTVAGNGTLGFSGDTGSATSAELDRPVDMVVDASGKLYIADWGNYRVRAVSSGVINTVVGNGIPGSSGDGGAAASAELDSPAGLAFDLAGNLYIADFFNHRVRVVSTTGTITTYAGNGTQGSTGDSGPAASAEIADPFSVVTDKAGDLYISDGYNQRIRMVTSQGIINTVAGDGTGGFSGDGGAATLAEIFFPTGIALDQAGNLYIADSDNQRIRLVGSSATVPAAKPVFNPAGGSFTSGQSISLTDSTAGATIYYTTDGSTPSIASTQYNGAIAVNATTTIEAIAVASGYANSPVATATYTIIGAAASIGVVSGSGQTTPYGSAFANPLVAIVKDANGNPVPGVVVNFAGSGLSFTGSPATTGSNGEASVTATATATGSLTAVASTSGVTATASFSLTASTLGTALMPTFTPSAGTYTSAQQVTISDSTTGAAIYYTIGASTPSASSTQYSAAIAVGSTETINAIAIAPGYANSPVATAAYTINLPSPSFSLSASPTSATISGSSSAMFTLSVTPENGFSQAVSFSCSGLPSGDACSFSPPTVTPAGAAASTTLTIASASSAKNENARPWEKFGEGMAFALMLWPFCRRRGRRFCAIALLSLSVLAATGCVSSPKAHSYTVTVTASGGSVTQTASLNLTVAH